MEIDDGIAWITLNRPEKRNAMSPTLNREMGQVLDLLELRDEVGVLVLTGAGESFSLRGHGPQGIFPRGRGTVDPRPAARAPRRDRLDVAAADALSQADHRHGQRLVLSAAPSRRWWPATWPSPPTRRRWGCPRSTGASSPRATSRAPSRR
ncbi:MAG: enoyl-CoA hydratase-related protein [Sphingomonas sp.]